MALAVKGHCNPVGYSRLDIDHETGNEMAVET